MYKCTSGQVNFTGLQDQMSCKKILQDLGGKTVKGLLWSHDLLFMMLVTVSNNMLYVSIN